MNQDHNEWRFDTDDDHQNYPPEEESWKFQPKMYGIILIVIIVLVLSGWYFFTSDSDTSKKHDIPLIKAQETPIKIRPENAGEPDVPHQDKLVYNHISPSPQPAEIERLLPRPEEPINLDDNEQKNPDIEKEVSKSEKKKATAVLSDEIFEPKETIKNLEPAKNQSENSLEIPLEKQLVTEKVIPQENTQKSTETNSSRSVARKKTAPLKKGFRVQIASLPSQFLAEKEWKRLKHVHRKNLYGLNPQYVRVDLGAKKGIFYRIQIGEFSTQEKAQNFCKKLQKTNPKQGCLAVPFSKNMD